MSSQRGHTEIELGGTKRRLRYDLNALAEIQERMGLEGMSQIMEKIRDLDFISLRLILWAGMIREDPELTPQQVGAWVGDDDAPDLNTIAQAMSSALAAAFARDGQGEAPAPAASGTGEPPAASPSAP